MVAILQTACSNAFLVNESILISSNFHWGLSLNIQLTIICHWFGVALNKWQAIIWTNDGKVNSLAPGGFEENFI